MKAFDLQKALAGEKVVTRDGQEVTQVTTFKGMASYLYGVLGGRVVAWDSVESTTNLFMAHKKLSGFVNVYENGDVGQIAHETIEAAMFGRSGIKTCIACIDLSQFEEGHGL